MQDWLLGLHHVFMVERGKERIFSDGFIGIRKEYILRGNMVWEVVFETIAMGTCSHVSTRQ